VSPTNRLPNTPATGATSYRRAEEPAPACLGRSEPYDLLHDYVSGPIHERAKTEAERLCKTCPLYARDCWDDPSNEMWVRSIRGQRRPGPPPSAKCGTSGGARRHYKLNEKVCAACREWERQRQAKKREEAAPRQQAGLDARRAAQAAENERRMAGMRELAEVGGDLHDACRVLGLRRDTLNKWCQRHGVTDLYHRLAGTRPKKAAA
jgi:hypothetical protein